MSKKRKRLPPEERFKFLDDTELEQKLQNLENKNTRKTDCKTERKFMQYLKLKDIHDDYWLIPEQELDRILRKFWFEVRTQEGDYYKIGSLDNLHYSLNRLLQSKGHESDIVHGDSFIKSHRAFSKACEELKQKGYGVRESYKEITPAGTIIF